jgi:hypothetical protein
MMVPAPGLRAQPGTLYAIPRIDDVVLDGRVTEPGWEAIEPVPLVQYEPAYGQPPTERTEIRFAHDDDYFYASIRAWDSDPGGIRANTLYRDRLSGSDHFELMIDTYNDNETGYIFTTSPAGIRHDAAITNDASGGTILGGGWLNRDFNTFWDAEVTVTEEGWFAEMRIPFASLRFQVTDGRVIMGLTAQRKIARKSERLVFPDIGPIADWAFLRPSLAQKIVMEGVQSRKRVYVTPYALAGVSQRNMLNGEKTAYESRSEWEGQPGGDIKYSLTNHLTLDATVNMDFAQAEADDQMVNLTRFSLFYPEKRQFFQERAGIFDFRTGGQSRLFNSRTIGLTEEGQPVNILGGLRLVGRESGWDIGLMNLQTARSDSLPSENFGVLRLRRRVFNAFSYAGAMVTSRTDFKGNYNVGYGLDGVVRVSGYDYLTVQWAQTFDNLTSEVPAFNGLNSGQLALELLRRKREGFGFDLGTVWSGRFYNPGLGFVQRRDYWYGKSDLSYTWLLKPGAPFIWHTALFGGFLYRRNLDGAIESAAIGPAWNFSSRTTSSGGIDVKMVYENIPKDFYLSPDAWIPVGSYRFYQAAVNYNMRYERLLRTGILLEGGTFYDGWKLTLGLTPTWYVSKHLEFTAEYFYNRVRFDERGQQFNAHITRLRIGTALNTKLSTNAFIQYNSTIAQVSANIRFRYNFREGNDLWIVFNDGLNTDRYRLTPELPLNDNWALLIKYTYTFQF